ncbi:MAG: arsenite-transporting ATPase [Myxococcota bacterium]
MVLLSGISSGLRRFDGRNQQEWTGENSGEIRDVKLATLLSSRLILVTGKGGTGKTSLSAAIGTMSAARGRRTLIVEVDNFHPSLTRLFGIEPVYAPRRVSDKLFVCNLTWMSALKDWLKATVKSRRVTKLILDNRMATVFLDATPGAREIVILSKIVGLMDEFDQVVVDLPASGHALGILRVPRTATRLMRSGPVREKAEQILEVFAEPSTVLAIIGLPEEMVVNETLELWEKIHQEVPEIQAPKIFLNRSSSPSLTDDEITLLNRLETELKDSPEAAELLQAGRWEEELETATADALKRLEEAMHDGVISFPRLGALGGFDRGPAKVVEQMSKALSRQQLAEDR